MCWNASLINLYHSKWTIFGSYSLLNWLSQPLLESLDSSEFENLDLDAIFSPKATESLAYFLLTQLTFEFLWGFLKVYWNNALFPVNFWKKTIAKSITCTMSWGS